MGFFCLFVSKRYPLFGWLRNCVVDMLKLPTHISIYQHWGGNTTSHITDQESCPKFFAKGKKSLYSQLSLRAPPCSKRQVPCLHLRRVEIELSCVVCMELPLVQLCEEDCATCHTEYMQVRLGSQFVPQTQQIKCHHSSGWEMKWSKAQCLA